MGMSAMERIKKLEDDHNEPEDEYWCQMCGWDGVFLFKAFKAMREIAIKNTPALITLRDSGEVLDWAKSDKLVDEEFEERMGENGSRS